MNKALLLLKIIITIILLLVWRAGLQQKIPSPGFYFSIQRSSSLLTHTQIHSGRASQARSCLRKTRERRGRAAGEERAASAMIPPLRNPENISGKVREGKAAH